MNPAPIQDVPPRPAPNWARLRAELLGLVEGFAHRSWTDYNVHDPGITLGELFAFGVSEGTHVAGLPIADLRQPPEGTPAPPSPDFPGHLTLPCRPLTLHDYRKLLIDVDGIRNAWITTVEAPDPRVYVDCPTATLTLDPGTDRPSLPLRGFYRAQVEIQGEPSVEQTLAILTEARSVLSRHRNLAEVFLDVSQVPVDHVGICADLVAAEGADLEDLAARIYLALETFLAPPIPFRTLDECLRRGLDPDDIFDGPLLRHGFVDPADLDAAERKSELRASDLVQILLDVPGVVAVRKLLMTRHRAGVAVDTGEPWRLVLDPSRASRLSLGASRLLFFKRDLPFLVREVEVRRKLQELRASDRREKQAPAQPMLPEPDARRRNIDTCRTLLDLLPLNYGVGAAGLPPSAPPLRQAQARQLEGYFLLGELFLSGLRTQVARLPEVISLRRSVPTLFATPPSGVRDFPTLAFGKSPETFAADLQLEVEREPERVRRRNALADHWLARLATPYDPFLLISSGRQHRPDPERLLGDKLRLLEHLPSLARDRAAASDLAFAAPSGRNLSGFETWLHTLLGTGPDLESVLQVQPVAAAPAPGSPAWRFRILRSATEPPLDSIRTFLTAEGATAEADLAGRSGLDPNLYRGTGPVDGTYGFELIDAVGERLASSSARFPTAAARDAAIASWVAFFRGLPADFEGYLLEHILLRPRPGSTRFLPVCDPNPGPGGACPQDDPYSFRLTLVLPSWPRRFSDLHVREDFERVARELLPAHLFLKICWIPREKMDAFRTAWNVWRRDLAAESAGRTHDLPRSQDALIDVWLDLRSQFPVATLHDCVDDENDENPIVLDRSRLGTLQKEPPS